MLSFNLPALALGIGSRLACDLNNQFVSCPIWV